MNIRNLIEDLERYPDDYVPVVSQNKDGQYVIVALDPIKYYKVTNAHPITNVVTDRRKYGRGDSGKQNSVRS